MPTILTHELKPGDYPEFQQQIYCGLDTTITAEVMEVLQQTHNQEPAVYSFALALQAPALEMMLRGFRVDQLERQKGIDYLRGLQTSLQATLNSMALAVWGKPLNPNSPKQLIEFFYSAMHLPEVWISQKGVRKLSTSREALEKLEVHFHAMPIIATILALRDTAKRLSVLEKEIDPDGRIRTSYNIAGTETGRWSSSGSSTGTGDNLQNWNDLLRKILIPDPGHYLIGIDLEQAESREVGWTCGTLFGDWTYYDACLAGDLHTTTARLIWPSLEWSGNAKSDRALAERPFYRTFSYRDMSKRGGHGSNYYGTPFTMARHLKVPSSLMEEFQSNYFGAYPGIPKWHKWVARELQTTRSLTTLFGRERQFFGRPDDDTTLREAIAFGPQSTTADRLNLILWRIWRHMPEIQLLAQVHDALYFQVPMNAPIDAIITKALGFFDIPLEHPSGRRLIVPGEAKIGLNWGTQHLHGPNCPPNCLKLNPGGLRKWRPGMELPKPLALLDRVM